MNAIERFVFSCLLTDGRSFRHSLGIVLHDLAGISDQHANGHGVPQDTARSSFPASAKLLYHFGNGHPVLLSDQVQQTESVVLHDVASALNLPGSRTLAVAVAATAEIAR